MKLTDFRKRKMKDQIELDDELCNYCPRDPDKQGVYGVPGGYTAGCEGSDCNEAYNNYKEAKKNEQINS